MVSSGWSESVAADWSRGIIRDVPRTSLPQSSLYDLVNGLVSQPGMIFKRGGTSYAGPALTSATYARAVAYANFSQSRRLMSVGSNGDLYYVTSGTTYDVNALGSGFGSMVDKPKMMFGSRLILPADGATTCKFYRADNFTVTIASPGVFTLNNHGFSNGDKIYFSTTGALPTNLSVDTAFYVHSHTTNTFQVAATSGGSAVNTSGTQSGTHTVYSVSSFPASCPQFKYFDVFKSYIAVAGVTAQPQRIYFSPRDNASPFTDTWNTTLSYWDFDNAVTGLCSLQNSLLVFMEDGVHRLVGNTAPPGGDFAEGPVGPNGCTDARSIVTFLGNAIYASPTGVYITNGVSPVSLTDSGLVTTYWQSLFTGYDPKTWTIAAGTDGQHYIVTILDGSGTFVDCLICDVARRAWVRASNIKADMFTDTVGAASELYYADRSTNRVVTIGSSLLPSASNKNDADGTAVALTAELRLAGSGPNLKRFGHSRLTYDMRDAASDNPTLAVSFAENVTAPSFTAAPESPLSETSDVTRKRFTINREAQSVTVKLAQSNASSKTEIYAVEIEEFPLSYVAEGA